VGSGDSDCSIVCCTNGLVLKGRERAGRYGPSASRCDWRVELKDDDAVIEIPASDVNASRTEVRQEVHLVIERCMLKVLTQARSLPLQRSICGDSTL
jgi:hypothetical protein